MSLFCRIQNLHISQTRNVNIINVERFCRIQNLHISQTVIPNPANTSLFCRIQNLHISQTERARYEYNDKVL